MALGGPEIATETGLSRPPLFDKPASAHAQALDLCQTYSVEKAIAETPSDCGEPPCERLLRDPQGFLHQLDGDRAAEIQPLANGPRRRQDLIRADHAIVERDVLGAGEGLFPPCRLVLAVGLMLASPPFAL